MAKDLKTEQEELDEKVKKCYNEINAVLDRYGLAMDLSMILRYGNVTPKLTFIPKTPPPAPAVEPTPDQETPKETAN